MFWLDWRELEKHNDWGVRDKDDATAALWNDGAEQWEKRSAGEVGFAQKQVDALTRITKETTVLDVCCGTGPLTLPLAKKARQVTAFDFNEKMLDFVRRKAAEAARTTSITFGEISIPSSPERIFSLRRSQSPAIPPPKGTS